MLSNELPDTDLVSGTGNQLARLAESVARMDGRMTAEMGALKNDTEAARSYIHEINNRLTEMVATDRLHGQALATLADGFKLHSATMDSLQTIGTQFLVHVRGCEARGVRMEKAVWWAIGIGVSLIGTLAMGVVYLAWNHFTGKVP